ncbi:FMN-binding protein [Micromonospora sp. NPDC049559]|uniref:FMN-binding protein n=1 Tax=Micromonospora sp. NPDC049559 TaxID=3155923 RepID=UPI0034228837
MRRAILAIGGLAASTTLLVAVKGAPAVTPVAQAGAAGRSGASGAPSGPAAGGASSDPTAKGSAPPGRSGGAKPPAGARTTGPANRPPAGPVTVTGALVANEYGNVRVRVTLNGTDITAVTALELPESTADSTRRSASVRSRMGAQAVQRDSADLDTVSGATATSDSYRQSLQAALDRAARGERG